MASVYRPLSGSGKPTRTWFAIFYIPDATGKKVLRRKSTGVTDRAKALAVAVAWEKAGRIAGEGRMTQAKTREVLADILETVGAEPMQEFTAEAWMTHWLDIKTASSGARTVERYGKVIEKFVRSLGPRARQSLEHVGSGDIAAFLKAEFDGGRTAHTVNLEQKILNQAFRAAIRRGLLRDNPCAPLEMRRDTGGGEGRAPFTVEEVERLLRVSGDEWRGVILTGLYTAARLGDVVALRWKNVDLTAGIIRFRPKKTARTAKRDLTVPIAAPLREYLESLPPPAEADAPLFPALSRQRMGGTGGLSLAFKAIMARAGIETGVARERAGTAGRAVSARTFHSLRHSINSWMHNAGVSQEIRQRVLGHASAEVNAIYTHSELATLQAALAAVPAVGRREDKT